MASEVGIANIALTALGGRLITSVNDEGAEAELVRTHYPTARDATLEARQWTFALKRVSLALSTEIPVGGGSLFTLPADTIRVIDAEIEVDDRLYNLDNRLFWEVEGPNILADADTCRIRYIRRIEDTNAYTPAFTSALSYRLAFEMCIGITQSRFLQKVMLEQYELKLAAAAATDGMQGVNQQVRATRLLRSRTGFFTEDGGFAIGDPLT